MAFSSASKNPYQMTWQIYGLRTVRKNDSRSSDVFPSNYPFAFQMSFSQNEEGIIIKLYMVKSDEPYKELDYRISFLDSAGDKRLISGGKGEFSIDIEQWAKYQSSTVLISSLSSNYCIYHGSNIRIHCEIDVPGWELHRDSTSPSPKTYAIESSPSEAKSSKLADDMQELLNSGEQSDVTLVFGGGSKQFLAHKVILSARSSVFKLMFQHDFKEKLENQVEIPDIDEEVGQEMLTFLYTEKAPNLDQFALELFAAADRYELESLKKACERSLSAKLSIDTVAKILIVADMHRALELKEKCFDYITDHSKQVMATEGWKELTTRPELFPLLFEKLSLKK